MKRLSFLLVCVFSISLAAANDQVRDVQAELKKQGFYYGEVNGTDGAETTAAIRRFQIRNGLTVTGKVNAETLAALGLGGKGAAPGEAPPPVAERPMTPQVNPPPAQGQPVPGLDAPLPPAKRGRDFVRDPEGQEEPVPPQRRIYPDDPSVIEPPVQLPAPVYTPFATLFRGTPYDSAPREVQMDTLRRAQALMASMRLYQGIIDGIPGPATSEAIFAYQETRGLDRTGRLNLDTLADMRLLPRGLPRGVPVKPFYNPNRHRDSSLSWGFWIR
jgi:peptidoglycan hydrolase-like protein with peptidoglycan-binding domain